MLPVVRPAGEKPATENINDLAAAGYNHVEIVTT
jgi:hypothetical protein